MYKSNALCTLLIEIYESNETVDIDIGSNGEFCRGVVVCTGERMVKACISETFTLLGIQRR